MRLIDADELKDHIKIFNIGCGCSEDYQKSFLNAIDEQPTIDPERKTGRWTHAWGTDDGIWKCSECGYEIDAHGCVDPVEYLETYKFCPNCGSDNREEGDRT